MNVVELLGLPSKIGGRGGFGLGQKTLVLPRKAFGDIGHLDRCLRQGSIFTAARDGVADEQEPPCPWLIFRMRALEQAKGTSVRNGDVFNPVVWFWIGREQCLKVQCIEAAVRNNKDFGGLGKDKVCRLHEHAVQGKTVGILRFSEIFRCLKSLSVTSDSGIDL